MGEVHYSTKQNTATLELSNPKRGNSLDFTMLDQLEQAVSSIEQDNTLKLAVLKADYSCKHFCTGADIAAWSSLSPECVGPDWIDRGNRLFDRLASLPVPTVALVHGLCLGGGLELVLTADVLFASEAAAFAFPEVGIGAIPGWKGGLRLSERVGRSRAAHIVFTGERIAAQQALEWGLVTQVWTAAEFTVASQAALDNMAAQPVVAMREAKRLFPVSGQDGLNSGEHGKALQACMLTQHVPKED